MGKKAGPSLRLMLPELVDCPSCNGAGKTKGIFYHMVCDVCGGSGVVDKETGERLPDDQIIPALKATVRHLKTQLHLTREELRKGDSFNPYPENMPDRHGGKYRMD